MIRSGKGQGKGLTLMLSWALVSIAAASNIRAGDEVYSITKEQALRNRYVMLLREYPSSALYYSVGEVDVHHGTTRTGIPLYDSSGIIVSRTFTPTSENEISLYHEVRFTITRSVGDICTNAPTETVPIPSNWASIVGDITDTLVLRLVVESLSGGPEPYVVDSVTIFPNPTSQCVDHEGTSLNTITQRRTIPALFSGKRCRLRLEIDGKIRYGPEVRTMFNPSSIALSVGRTPSGLSTLSPEQYDSIHRRYQVLAASFMRQTLMKTDDMSLFNHLFLDDSLHDPIIAEYFDVVRDSNNNQVYHYEPKALSISGVLPNVGRRKTDVSVFIPEHLEEVRWVVIDTRGKELKSGRLRPDFKGRGWIAVPYPPPLTESYILRLVDPITGISRERLLELD